MVPIKVQCHAGYKANEYPICFYRKDKKFEIKEIIDRWDQRDMSPEWQAANYFKVITASGEQYILKYEIEKDSWYIV
jgi:hypothetical protein